MDRSFILPQQPPEPTVLFISEQDEEVRIDKLLSERYPQHSRTYFQAIIEQGYVLLNGEPVKKGAFLEEGDEIEVCFPLTPESTIEPESIPLVRDRV